jgi:TRAP-type C4-dicarboxylate transport system substrate-binding protein
LESATTPTEPTDSDALQTGLVDAHDFPPFTGAQLGFYDSMQQVILTWHLTVDHLNIIKEDVWQSLSEEHQQVLVEASKLARAYHDEIIRQGDVDTLAALQEKGLDVYEPDVRAFADHAMEYYLSKDEWSGTWAPGMLEEIQALYAE